jgi:protein-S-isoprenylcysteine O-methyltransferase Ste14
MACSDVSAVPPLESRAGGSYYGPSHPTHGALTMWQIMAFFVGALLLALFSRRVFSNLRSHGFFRFLAFVSGWAVITISAPRWFQDLLSARQIVSWLLLIGSALLAASGFYLLKAVGKPSPKGTSTDFAFEQTSRLVTTGPFRYIRHPLYASLILLVWGAMLKSGSLASIFFTLLATGFLFITARAEEEENLERFGEAYAEYMERTKMFVPGVF